MINYGIVESFCTPPEAIETDMDKKLLEDAEPGELSFEGMVLKTYSWGTGRNILLAHGWGSRASHLAFIGRNLARAGFHIMAFDGPAHGNSLKKDGKNISNMFEFCRAVKCAADRMQP
jgi:alpha-beta hydrolase superfamily lysophospholipase